MEVFACLAGTDVRVPVELDADETVCGLRDKAVRCLGVEGQVSDGVSLRLAGSGDMLGGDDTLLQHTQLEAGATVEVVLIPRQAFGPDEGVTFDDGAESRSWGRVVGIDITASHTDTRAKMGLALTYANGVCVAHGCALFSNNARGHIILDEDEYVTGVRGWCGELSWQSITFITNKRHLGPFEAHSAEGARTAFSLDFGAGDELTHVYGRIVKGSITQIGFGSGRPVNVPRVRRTPLISYTADPFATQLDDDSAEGVHLRARICGVSVWTCRSGSQSFVNGLGVAYTDGTYLRHIQTISMDDVHTAGLHLHTVALDGDEFISGVDTVMNEDVLNLPIAQIAFTTNKRRIGPFGTGLGGAFRRHSETFDGELLFIFSEPDWLGRLGFGHGPPATTATRTMTQQEVLQGMQQAERQPGLLRYGVARRKMSLLEYVDHQPSIDASPRSVQRVERRRSTRVTETAHSDCGCTVC
eukprot:TRINITY_DN605_c0_g1_i18.p1 TRINITY_DN605_c0_g1~~TRINITY_DN605_c0_g1_i18.p1  ORF type:complete len:491 (+),score=76.11 TRINITY_DN605_c0_g1_i18:62-1474(+)